MTQQLQIWTVNFSHRETTRMNKVKHRVLRQHILPALALGGVLVANATFAAQLASYNVDIKQTSVSGLSSGAFMTSQLYVTHSDIMVGAGIVAGGPYLCAKSYETSPGWENASVTCMSPKTSFTGPNTKALVEKAREYAAAKQIDPLENLQDDRIYIYTGKNDKTVTTQVVDETNNFFLQVGVPASSIQYARDTEDAGHAFITLDKGNKCDVNDTPYISDCDDHQAMDIIQQIYPDARAPAEEASGKVIAFDQKEFIGDDQFAMSSMSDTGHIYVPKACEEGTEICRVHVAIHGCGQSDASFAEDKVEDTHYYTDTGYNSVADSNNLIILYPQVDRSDANPRGCWDFWGYTDENFYSQDGVQIKALYHMIQRLAGGKQ